MMRTPPASKRASTGETRIQNGSTRPELADDAYREPGAHRDLEPAPESFEECPLEARILATFDSLGTIPLGPGDSRVSEIEGSRQPHSYAGRDRIR